MANDFEEFKKRYASGQTKMLSNPAPLPGPGGIARAAFGKGVEAVSRTFSKKTPKKTDKEVKPQRPTSSKKTDKVKKQTVASGKTNRQAGNFAGRRMEDAKVSRGPFGTLATQGTRAVTKYERPGGAVTKYERPGGAVTKFERQGGPLVKSERGPSAMTVAGGRTNFGGGGSRVVGPSNASRSASTGKSNIGPKDEGSNSKGVRKYTSKVGPQKPVTVAANKTDNKGVRKYTSKVGPNKPASAAVAPTSQFKSDAAQRFAKGQQGIAGVSVKKQDSTANQGAKKNKPTKIVKQATAKSSYNGNWKNAAPTKSQARGGALRKETAYQRMMRTSGSK